jgi:hypothetical protein
VSFVFCVYVVVCIVNLSQFFRRHDTECS